MRMRLELLTRGELERIHAATVRVLEATGIRVLDPEAVRLLEEAGAARDPATEVVRIPEAVLRECLEKAPRRFSVHGRGPGTGLAFGDGRTHMSSMGTAVRVEDLDGEVRPAALRDVEAFYRLVDALPHLDHASWVVWPQDVAEEAGHAHEILLGFRNTTKSLDGYNWGRQHAADTIDMAAIVAGGHEALARRPLLLGFVNPVSPLSLAKEMTEGLLVYARAGQPCIVAPECLAGGTAPVTLAGLLVQQNAEVLAAIAVAQCARAGSPVLYGSASTVMDMRSGAVAFGAPESGLIMAATAQLARFYGLPSRGTGGNTDAVTSDFQAGAESATTLLVSALAGFDFLYDCAGSVESSLTAGFAKLVLDHEICGEVKRIVAGVEVSEDTLAARVIEDAGLVGGYLGHPHTLAHFRTEHFIPSVFRRSGRAGSGGTAPRSATDEARERCRRILKDHVVDPPLEREIDRSLAEFVRSVELRSRSEATRRIRSPMDPSYRSEPSAKSK